MVELWLSLILSINVQDKRKKNEKITQCQDWPLCKAVFFRVGNQ